ncbi:hypothetical protein EMPG_12354 [Blastomyces silverae]|uniref:UBC core domain-containing protein n=1 Tax=Blastomyces silverae TaxID=2060906 RepID=A0A0H1BM83_9EURO|nr:hypothetical protein EMPG_12354 [Blastomyces silverae]
MTGVTLTNPVLYPLRWQSSVANRRLEEAVMSFMKDYKVELVNNSSDVRNITFVSPNPSLVVESLAVPGATLTRLPNLGKSSTYNSRDRKTHHSRAGSGKSMWNYLISTHTRVRASASSTEFTILILMSCETLDPLKNHILAPSNWTVRSGSVCLDVINQAWSPMFDMTNIFESFLPYLLQYPNPSDPLNGDAAAVLMRDPKKYEARVRVEYVAKYASKDVADEAAEDSESDDELSSVGSYMSGDEEPAGEMDDV